MLEFLVEHTKLPPSPPVLAWYQKIAAVEDVAVSVKTRPDAACIHARGPQLYPFQRVGVAFIRHMKRVLLCDEMGMGKTITSIVAAESVVPNPRVLVVCTKGPMEHWREKIGEWAVHSPEDVTMVRAGKSEMIYAYTSGWLIINWEMMRLCEDALSIHDFDVVIADEAHRCKNRKSQTFQALARLTRKSQYLILATGSPYANHPGELWALLNLVDPKAFPSYWRFHTLYVQTEQDAGGNVRTVPGVRHAKLLANELRSRMLMRMKKDHIADLPEVLPTVSIPLDLSPKQYRMYIAMARQMLAEISDGSAVYAMDPLGQALRLRQIASTTATLDPEVDESSKLDALMDLLADTEGKVVVFSMFRATVNCIAQRLAQAGVGYRLLIGGMSSDEVAATIDDFTNDDSVQVIAGTIQFGGESHNLQAASTVVFIDEHYNPVRQEQAIARLHRIGQKNPVSVVRLYCPGTVDDMVHKILEGKMAANAEIVRAELESHLRVLLKK